METRIIKAVFGASKSIVAPKRFKNDWGQVLELVGINLPTVFEAHFSNSKTGTAKKREGQNNRVEVPDEYFQSGADIYCWVMVHDEATDGRTMYTVRIPIEDRGTATDEEPTPVQQDIIAQTITALNGALDRAEASESAWENMRAESSTLDPNEPATASYEGGVLSLGIPKGEKGDKGDRGEQGIQGIKGDKGDTGAKGDPFVYSDFTPEQLASLKGEKGDKGDTGIQGVQGERGEKGDTGAQGIQGEKGEKGDKGDTGVTGQDGHTPVKGTDYWTAADKAEIVEDVTEEIDLSNYVQKTDYASSSAVGVAKVGDYGIAITDNNVLRTKYASSSKVKAGNNGYDPIVPNNQHESTFYGLAKAAGDTTQSASNNAVGTYTDEAKEKIHSMLNIADASAFGIVCNGETASQNIIKGQYVIWNGKLYIALVNIPSGTTLSVGNLVAVNDGFFNATALPKVYACYTAEEDMQAITLDFGSSYSFDVYDELVIVVYQSDTTQTSFCDGNWSYVYIKNNNKYAITNTSSLYFAGNQPNMIRLKRTPTGIFGNIINTTSTIKPIFVQKSADDELLISNILFNRSSESALLLTGTRIEAFLGRM